MTAILLLILLAITIGIVLQFWTLFEIKWGREATMTKLDDLNTALAKVQTDQGVEQTTVAAVVAAIATENQNIKDLQAQLAALQGDGGATDAQLQPIIDGLGVAALNSETLTSSLQTALATVAANPTPAPAPTPAVNQAQHPALAPDAPNAANKSTLG